MTEQTKAVVPYLKLKELMTSDEIRNRFAEILGKKSAGFMASILNTVYLDTKLRDAEPNSIINAAMTAAILDLPVDKNLGFSWIIPYNEGDTGKKARFQMGYKGYIQLAIRTAQYTDLNVVEIYQGEEVKIDRLTGRIVLNGKRNGDEVIGYCAYFKLLNGFEKFLYWTVEQVHAHGKHYAQSAYNNKKSAWNTDFDAMGKKTVIKALLSKYGLLSIEMQTAMKHDVEFDEPLPFAREIINAEPEPEPLPAQTFDPVAVVLDGGYAENEYAAKGMVNNYMPEEIKTNRDAVLTWAKIYRGWRDANPKMSKDECKAKADAGELPK